MTEPSKSAKIKHYKKGIFAEYYAAAFLTLKGYNILQRRYKTKVGEIDIIARKGSSIVMVEVKCRQSANDGLESVTPISQQRIRRAADHYLLAESCKSDKILAFDIRFDVIVINHKYFIRHIKNAF